jgi:hypothetical protein
MAINRKEAFKDALAELNKNIKSINIGLLPDLKEVDVQTVSTGSLILDNILGGGVAKGRIIEIYGSEASGKTSIALTMAGNIQKEGGNVVFLDVEQAFDPRYARRLGVDTDNLAISQPIIAEQCLKIVNDLCASGTVDMIVVDSVASMVPRAEYEQDDFEKATIGLVARLMSKALKQIAANAHKNQCTVVFLNQTRANVGVMYGPSTTTSGGNALKFYASQRIEVKRKGKVEEDGDVIGNEVFLKVIKNKIAPPFGEGLTVLTYKKGINKAAELLVLGEQLGIITKKGRTYYCPDSDMLDMTGNLSRVEGEIKIGVNPKPVLKEIEENQNLYNYLANLIIESLNSKNGFLDDSDTENSLDSEQSQELEN